MGIIDSIFQASLPGIVGTGVDIIGDRLFGPGDYGWNPQNTLPVAVTPASTLLTFGMGGQANLPAPAVTVIPATGGAMAQNNCGPTTQKQVVTYDCTTGAIVKISPYKRRKRRRRLATASDIADLEALKGILGKGQALQSYLAIYGRKG